MGHKIKFLLLLTLYSVMAEDKKWVWGDNNRNEKETSGRLNFQNFDKDASARYEVFEDENPNYERPHRPNFGPIQRPGGAYQNGPNGHPGGIYQNGPSGAGHYGGPIERPGGVYHNGPSGVGNSNYGQGHLHNNYPDYGPGGVLTGPVPSWNKEGPYKNYDKCKCTEKFNCNSPGISYGHCDVGKQYCCYSTKKLDQIGGPLPSRPVHSIENGVLVGPGGPHDGHVGRPGGPHDGHVGRPGGYPRPGGGGGGYPRPGGGFGRPDRYRPGSSRPVHSIENGILVGPGGPFDRPGGGGGRPGFGGGFDGGHSGGYGPRSADKKE